MAAIVQVEARQQNLQEPLRCPTHTSISQRQPHPDYEPVQPEPVSKHVARRKHRGKPPTPSPSRSTSTAEMPSSNLSSSSWESSPHKKKKGNAKLKSTEARARPSPIVAEIASTKIPKALE